MSSHYVLHLVQTYGYIGLAGLLVLGIVGLPLPDETLLTAVGYLVYRGHLAYIPAELAGIFGASVGISLSYLLGRWFGRPVVIMIGRRIGLTEERLGKVEGFFETYGGASLLIGLFIPGVRHVTAIAAGLAKMEYTRFSVFAYTGVCLWVTTFITLGRFAGPHLLFFERLISQKVLFTALLAAVFLGALWLMKKVFKTI